MPNLKYFYNCSPLLIEKLPKLEHLAIGSENVLNIIKGNILHKLKVVFLDFHESDIFSYEFLDTERLDESDIFCLQNPNTDEFLSHRKELRLDSLPNLTQSATSFSIVTYLEVSGCNALLYLFTSSIVKSLAHLKSLKIEMCDSIEEIVVCRDDSNEDEIIFPHLNCLTLKFLYKLRNFYKGSLSFPSLDQLEITGCSSMETLCGGTIKAEELFQVQFDYRPIPVKTDLNSTLMNAFLAEASFLDLRNNSKLQEIWLDLKLIPNKWFSELSSLVVDGCQFLSNAVLPFHLLPFFTKLKTLEVRNCDHVRTIFDVRCVKQDKEMATMGQHSFPLKKLSLSKLPNLRNIWNKDPQGILRMQLLQEIEVDNCKCLTSVFPASVVKNIMKFENLVLKHCERLMTIVEEDNNADPRGTNLELTFQYVKSFTLCGLPKFNYNAKCCIQDAKTFELAPNLQHLTLGENELKMIWHEDFLGNLSHKLKVFTFLRFVSEVFPYEFLQQVPNIERLEVRDSSFKEIFNFQSPGMDHTGLLPQLKELCLDSLPYLVCIGLENSRIEPFLKNPETLQVAPTCTVYFSNLTYLEVSRCESLVYLFTSSTARSLGRLKRLEIKKCKLVEKIVLAEDELDKDEEIIFEQLEVLYLEELDELRCFYSGNSTLHFPCLKQVYLIDCWWMKSFSRHNRVDDSTEWFYAKDGTPQQCSSDFNTAVHHTFQEKILKSTHDISRLDLCGSHPLQEIWLGSLVSIPTTCFNKLVSLNMDSCQFLSDAIIPFNLLSLLTKLKTLKVECCDKVKTIFDVKCITQDIEPTPIPFLLESLTLSKLPNLKNVWNGDPHGILSMQLLQVKVDDCKCLTNVFPATLAKELVKLEILAVSECEELITIVGEDNADTNVELTVAWPSVTSLKLCGLPNLKYFYNCSPLLIEKLTPNLQHLTLSANEMEMVWNGVFHGNLSHKLKVLNLLNFPVESNAFANEFLQQVPNIDKLEVSSCSFTVTFDCEMPNVGDSRLQSQPKVLSLESLPEINSNGLENTWIEPFLKNLETLDVSSCSCLRNLAPSSVYFSNLVCLFVFECHGLEFLFTSSVAKSLGGLKIMEIKNCESIEYIVSKKGGGSNVDDIIFWKLLYLNLESLPNLMSFYKGTLSFPSLVQLSVINCQRMETLCVGDVNADKLLGIKFQKDSDAIPWEIDINSTIRKATVPGAFSAFDYMSSTSNTNEDKEYGKPSIIR
ncbi:hypothetical protein Fmac_010606 [Flemingia macrophylla]|uniref:Disease resistance protein At4g27190-like leucine-rich repeats domain-containing protein n=1 Tax=Flemingia macrophylla TaxID=520843 RepID=A0ABD1MK36_9FABA